MKMKKTTLAANKGKRYGSAEWFVDEYRRVDDDPWGLSWRPSQKIRYERVFRLLDLIDSKPQTILDIGCATGEFTKLLSKRLGTETNVIGIDFIDTAIDRAEKNHRGVTFRKGTIFNIGQEYTERIDLVACLEVLYYLDRKDCPQALRSVKECLRPGGYVIFSSLISKFPYFSLNEFSDVVSSEFDLVRCERVHVKFLSLWERGALRVAKILRDRFHVQNSAIIPKKIFACTPFAVADLVEKGSSYMGNLFASHAMVLARKP